MPIRYGTIDCLEVKRSNNFISFCKAINMATHRNNLAGKVRAWDHIVPNGERILSGCNGEVTVVERYIPDLDHNLIARWSGNLFLMDLEIVDRGALVQTEDLLLGHGEGVL